MYTHYSLTPYFYNFCENVANANEKHFAFNNMTRRTKFITALLINWNKLELQCSILKLSCREKK